MLTVEAAKDTHASLIYLVLTAIIPLLPISRPFGNLIPIISGDRSRPAARIRAYFGEIESKKINKGKKRERERERNKKKETISGYACDCVRGKTYASVSEINSLAAAPFKLG